MPGGGQQQSIHRRGAASLAVCERAVQLQNVLHRVLILGPGRTIGQEMGEVRADHQQRFRPAPQDVQHLRHFGRTGVAHHQWDQRKVIQHRL